MADENALPSRRSSLPVAIDATGGDKGLDVQVEGAIMAYKEFGARSILVGPEEELKSKLELSGGKYFPISIRNATETIEMDESPVRAVRRKPDSSLCVAYKLVNVGQASSIISAGNTGAMMAAGRILCGLLPGIERPAIATLIPVAGEGSPNVILDSGANVDCSAHNLVQFAVMGAIYYKTLFGDEHPKVGVLSNGAEESKGNDVTRAAASILKERANINYVGYVEGRDVPKQIADVIVCDGFVGNVLLKAMEGSVTLILEQLKHESKKGIRRKLGLGLSKGMYKEVFKEKFNYSAYGGAPLLGLTKLALVLHGSSDSRAVKNAIRIADEFAEKQMVKNIAQALAQLEEALPDSSGDIVSGVFGKSQGLNGTGASAATSGLQDKDPKRLLTSEEPPKTLAGGSKDPQGK